MVAPTSSRGAVSPRALEIESTQPVRMPGAADGKNVTAHDLPTSCPDAEACLPDALGHGPKGLRGCDDDDRQGENRQA